MSKRERGYWLLGSLAIGAGLLWYTLQAYRDGERHTSGRARTQHEQPATGER